MFTPANKEKSKVLLGELFRFTKRILTPNLPSLLLPKNELYFFVRNAKQEEGGLAYPSLTSLYPTPFSRSLKDVAELVFSIMVRDGIPDNELKRGCSTLVFIYHDQNKELVAFSVFEDFDHMHLPSADACSNYVCGDKAI